MTERLLSVGLDVGTTSTQMVFSELLVENTAGAFAVPEMTIGERKIRYESEIYFTPLKSGELVDTAGLREIVDREYEKAGIRREQVDTGAIIITGETSRKENARAVLRELSGYAGEFVVAAAGPDLESVLAAKGSGAVAWSAETGKPVLHMDIGGGTTNLAWIQNGEILATGCLNVGGRLVRLDPAGRVTCVSPVLKEIWDVSPGTQVSRTELYLLAQRLTQVLEMAALLREPTGLLRTLWTKECGSDLPEYPGEWVISFSGGVADCIDRRHPWLEFGDMGPLLGQAIRESRLCRGRYMLGEQTIRATVIGAGCHSAQLTGSTVYCRNVAFPLKNIPVIRMEQPIAQTIRRELGKLDDGAILALPGPEQGNYAQISQWAEEIIRGFGERAVLVCLERDMAKALGQALALRLPEERTVLCIDRIRLPEGSYLDVAAPVGPALPVVVKTLVLER